MAPASLPYTEAMALWDAYYAPKAKARGYGGPAPPPDPIPRPQRLAKPAGRVDPRLAMMRSQIRRIEADILESERRCERRSQENEFWSSADGRPLLKNGDGSRVVIKGLAVPFGMVSHKIGGNYEKFRRGALMWDRGVPLVVGHRGAEVASTVRGTLKIWDEADGVAFSALLPDTPVGRAAVNFARLATGVSIRFLPAERVQNGPVVEVRKAFLSHIAILEPPSRPAYPSSYCRLSSERPPWQ